MRFTPLGCCADTTGAVSSSSPSASHWRRLDRSPTYSPRSLWSLNRIRASRGRLSISSTAICSIMSARAAVCVLWPSASAMSTLPSASVRTSELRGSMAGAAAEKASSAVDSPRGGARPAAFRPPPGAARGAQARRLRRYPSDARVPGGEIKPAPGPRPGAST